MIRNNPSNNVFTFLCVSVNVHKIISSCCCSHFAHMTFLRTAVITSCEDVSILWKSSIMAAERIICRAIAMVMVMCVAVFVVVVVCVNNTPL